MAEKVIPTRLNWSVTLEQRFVEAGFQPHIVEELKTLGEVWPHAVTMASINFSNFRNHWITLCHDLIVSHPIILHQPIKWLGHGD